MRIRPMFHQELHRLRYPRNFTNGKLPCRVEEISSQSLVRFEAAFKRHTSHDDKTQGTIRKSTGKGKDDVIANFQDLL